MRPDERTRLAVTRRLSGDAVDSRWWYWVAAVPATFALWVLAVAWVAVAVAAGPFVGGALGRAVEISMVAFGVPFLVLTAVFPFAAYADASAVLAADVGWRPSRGRLLAAAALGPLVVAAALVYALAARSTLTVPLWAVIVGFLCCVPVAAFYLLRRREGLGVP